MVAIFSLISLGKFCIFSSLLLTLFISRAAWSKETLKDRPVKEPSQLLKELDEIKTSKNTSIQPDSLDSLQLEHTNAADIILRDWETSNVAPIKIMPASTSNKTLFLDLEKALVIGASSNLSQRISKLSVRGSAWRLANNTSRILPDFELNFGAIDRSSRLNVSNGFQIRGGGFYQSGFSINYDLSPQEIFTTLASYYDWQAAQGSNRANLQGVLADIGAQYYNTLGSRGDLAIQLNAVKLSERLVTINQQLVSAGIGTRFNVLQAESELLQNRAAMLEQQGRARSEELRLLVLLNASLEDDLAFVNESITPREIFSPSQLNDESELLATAISQRPDIQSRIEAYRAAKARYIGAFGEVLPTLTAQYNSTSVQRNLGNSLESRNIDNLRSFFLGLNIPLLRGFGLTQISSINLNRTIVDQRSLEIEQLIQDVKAEVQQSIIQIKTSQGQMHNASEQLKVARQSLGLAELRLRNGIGSNIDFINAQRVYNQSATALNSATVSFNRAQIALLRSIGGVSVHNIIGLKAQGGGGNPGGKP